MVRAVAPTHQTKVRGLNGSALHLTSTFTETQNTPLPGLAWTCRLQPDPDQHPKGVQQMGCEQAIAYGPPAQGGGGHLGPSPAAAAPPTHIKKKMKLIQDARTWRPILGTHMFFWRLTHSPTALPMALDP